MKKLTVSKFSFTLLFSIFATSFTTAETNPPQESAANMNPQETALETKVTLETDWLELIPGFTGKKLGAEITKVEKLDDSGLSRIEISLPHDKKHNIEEVIVRGKRGSSEYDLTLNKTVEVIKDLDAGKTGIVVHVGGDKPFKLLINYIDYNQTPTTYQ